MPACYMHCYLPAYLHHFEPVLWKFSVSVSVSLSCKCMLFYARLSHSSTDLGSWSWLQGRAITQILNP